MAAVSPKAMTAALAHHWEVIERLCAHSRDVGSFELGEIERVIARALPARTAAEHAAVLQDLSDRNLVQRLPRSDRRRVHPDVLNYVQRLTRERDLGLSGVIKARIDRIQSAAASLVEATERMDRSGMVGAARQLWQQFDDISTQLDQDRHAILEIAERAKAADASLPLVVRYRQVLDAYDQYVDPMVSMLDSGPGGIFHQYLQAAGDALDSAVQVLATTHGNLVTESRVLRDAAFQSRELRRLGREVMAHSAATLLPLRNEVRDHSTLAASVGAVMGLVRKKGARRILANERLPFCARERYHKLSAGPELVEIMAAAMHFVPARIEFPDELAGTEAAALDVVEIEAVRGELAQAGGTTDLLAWLTDHHPDWQDATVLAMFHTLATPTNDRAPQQAATATWQSLKTIRVQHHPLVVEASSAAEGSA